MLKRLHAAGLRWRWHWPVSSELVAEEEVGSLGGACGWWTVDELNWEQVWFLALRGDNCRCAGEASAVREVEGFMKLRAPMCPWDKRGVPAWFPPSREEELRNLIPRIYFSITISSVLHPDSFSRFHWSRFMVLWWSLGIQGWALWRPCSWGGSRDLWSRQAVAAAQILGTWKNTSPMLAHWLAGRAGNVSQGLMCQPSPEGF